ncbi:antizyme inhibitor 2-like isoform X2 [Protopterus annectens]|uniref:antizyme inhibitor 2-like isoform X2 n=1 Tax=Protopterus annectens TaxID=7888 RepID=UPI001CFA14CF|nr:antizyme inhibitor 2-like isoform X2 [Protopterus annectens]
MASYISESDIILLEEGFTTKDILEAKINEASVAEENDAFFVADVGDVVKKHLRFLKAMPRVKPFYAVKCNSSRTVVQTLAEMGAGFDCASKAEIQLVRSLGVPADRIIYANPCKQISQIKYASNQGVRTMTFDNEVELTKVARNHPNASFHVGSGCSDPQAFAQAIADARLVFEMGLELGHSMQLLDIGGGFPGTDDCRLKFEEVAAVINPSLDLYFPEGCGVDIIAEPGRYYVASAFTLAVNIIAKKEIVQDQSGSDDEDYGSNKNIMYYINDGVYGSFNCIFFDHARVKPLPHKKLNSDQEMFNSSIWGPTCDGLDRILDRCELPELQVGDWLIFENMGAYTVAAASTFNGFQHSQIYSVMSRAAWQKMKHIKEGVLPIQKEQEILHPPMSCGWEIADMLCTPQLFGPSII